MKYLNETQTGVIVIIKGLEFLVKHRLDFKIRLDNDQFEYINQQIQLFQPGSQPIISVDTKKKEVIGDLMNRDRQSHVSKDIGDNK
ncbi:MAG: hypothetical protein JSV88_01285 [Candidatus Aminicenantes bacterium]|nr:MAG: hypothetical protein JSV88_01285 [Candidatus Aminicenantes bacterium]